MKLALALGFLTFTLLAVSLVWARTRLLIVQSRLQRAEEDAIDFGLDTRMES
jgi:heme exporter protein C